MRFGAVCATMLVLIVSGAAVSAGVELRPGAVVDDAWSTVYLMQPGGGIAAVDLATGTTRWTTGAAARPLYADAETLVAQVETPGREGALRIAIFDPRDPDRDPVLATVPLPQGARATVTAGIKRTFEIHAWRDETDILVRWSARKLPGPTGMDTADTADTKDGRNATQEWNGAARIPLGRGALREIDPELVPDPRKPRLPGIDKADRPPGQARANRETIALVELENSDPRKRARVRRWNAGSGRELAPLTVFGDGNQVKNLSSDGRHLLGSRPGRDESGFPVYTWSVIDLDSGARVASFRRPIAAASFLVVGNQILVEALPETRVSGGQRQELPLRMLALDAASGEPLWSREIRDTEYRGTLPPARR